MRHSITALFIIILCGITQAQSFDCKLDLVPIVISSIKKASIEELQVFRRDHMPPVNSRFDISPNTRLFKVSLKDDLYMITAHPNDAGLAINGAGENRIAPLYSFLHACGHTTFKHTKGGMAASAPEMQADTFAGRYLAQMGFLWKDINSVLSMHIKTEKEIRIKNILLGYQKIRPAPKADYTPYNNNCIAPCQVTLTSNSKNTNELTRFIWNNPEKDNQGEKLGSSAVFSFDSPPGNVVTLKVINSDGQEDAVECKITILPPSPLIAKFSVNHTSCEAPCLVEIKNETENAGAYKNQWSFGDGYNSDSPFLRSHSYDNPGNYTIELTVYDETNQKSTISKTITVSQKQLSDTNDLPAWSLTLTGELGIPISEFADHNLYPSKTEPWHPASGLATLSLAGSISLDVRILKFLKLGINAGYLAYGYDKTSLTSQLEKYSEDYKINLKDIEITSTGYQFAYVSAGVSLEFSPQSKRFIFSAGINFGKMSPVFQDNQTNIYFRKGDDQLWQTTLRYGQKGQSFDLWNPEISLAYRLSGFHFININGGFIISNYQIGNQSHSFGDNNAPLEWQQVNLRAIQAGLGYSFLF